MDKRELIHKITRYITELQATYYMLQDNKDRDDILAITKIDIEELEKQLENF